ncbi:MAG: hypothetical protein Fur0018_23520 [Anaerolineales bacterium]
MSENIHPFECPNCGAPLEIPEQRERFFRCQFCGTMLENQAHDFQRDPPVYRMQTKKRETAPASARPKPKRGWIIVLIFMLFMGILAAIVPLVGSFWIISQPRVSEPGIRFIQYAEWLFPHSAQRSIAGIANFSDDTRRFFYLDAQEAAPAYWYGSALSKDVAPNSVIFTGDARNLYIVFDGKLSAYQRATG